LRFGEVTELRRNDITDGRESITVSRGVGHRSGCLIDTTRTDRARTVVLPPHIRADIKNHLDTSYVGPAPEALLFTSRGKCGHVSQNVFREAFNAACDSIGREGVTAHALRHFGATMATRGGGRLAEVQVRLGHSTVQAAMLYQHAVSGRDAEIAAALSAMAESD
jgi:integrase